MAGQDRTAARALEAELGAAPTGFDFFQALRLLECAHRDRPRIGKAKRAHEEPLRVCQEPYVRFPTTSVVSYEPGEAGGAARLKVLLMGLFGPHGPLPLHLTVYARHRRRREGDSTIVDFCDVFHHRMLSLFYRAWAEARPYVHFDRPEEDRFGIYVAALCGLGLAALRNRDVLPDRTKLRHAGLLACQVFHPGRIEALVRNFLASPVRITEFVGGWLEVPPHLRCRLGKERECGQLGVNVVVGMRSFQCQHRFRIRLGPLELADYLDFLPGARRLARLVATVRNLVGDEFEWDVRLVLARASIPPLRLDGNVHLGWTSWLPAKTRTQDAEDLVLRPCPAGTS
jgi:type VI secretion system protein ImpH